MPSQDHKESMLALASAIRPFTSLMVQRLWSQAAREASWASQQLLDYARSYSPTRLERAIDRLMSYGVQDLASLRFILEQDLDLVAIRGDADLDSQIHLPFESVPL